MHLIDPQADVFALIAKWLHDLLGALTPAIMGSAGFGDAERPPAPPRRHPPSTNRRRVPTRRSTGGNRVRESPPSWPGRLPAPSPATVPPQPLPAELLDAGGRSVRLSDPDMLTAPPHRLVLDTEVRTVQGWAGPWPLHQRWWSPEAVASSRVQVLATDGAAFLLLATDGRWWVTGIYD